MTQHWRITCTKSEFIRNLGVHLSETGTWNGERTGSKQTFSLFWQTLTLAVRWTEPPNSDADPPHRWVHYCGSAVCTIFMDSSLILFVIVQVMLSALSRLVVRGGSTVIIIIAVPYYCCQAPLFCACGSGSWNFPRLINRHSYKVHHRDRSIFFSFLESA